MFIHHHQQLRQLEVIMATKKWIQGAIKKPGALTAMAKRKGMTPAAYCAQPNDKLSALAQRR